MQFSHAKKYLLHISIDSLPVQVPALQRCLGSVIEGRPADPLSVQMKTYIHMIRNFDKRDSLVHPVVFAVEHQGSFDGAFIFALVRHVSVSFSGLNTPRMLKSPSASYVFGATGTNVLDLKVMTGLFYTSKKSLPFSLPFFIPLPVSTLAACMVMDKTLVVSSAEVNVSAASQLSNFPASATEAFR